MGGFVPQGFEKYCQSLRLEMEENESALKEQLRAANSDVERSRIKMSIRGLRQGYNEKIRQAKKSFY